MVRCLHKQGSLAIRTRVRVRVPDRFPEHKGEDVNSFFFFGVVDNGLLVLGILAGIDFGDYLIPKKYRGKGAGIAVGGLIGNAISDGVAGVLSTNWIDAVNVTAGCLACLVAMPFILRRVK